MGLGRRKVRLEDEAAWVFNKMVEAYPARPPYPNALISELLLYTRAGVTDEPIRVLDVGAGIGHLALPLAAQGCEVVALEPARRMLSCLETRAEAQGLRLEAVHGTAEALPFEAQRFDLVIVSDALHFLDAELAGREAGRVLAQGGVLALLTCGLSDTPFMQGLVRIMEQAAPRRPRDLTQASVQFFRVAQATVVAERSFTDEHPVDAQILEQILRSISFVGPAMNAERFSDFMKRVRALPATPVWARTFAVRLGIKR